MTEPTFGQGAPADDGIQDPGSGNINPAWNEVLSAIPEEAHSQVIPHLRKWDEGVQRRFSEVHSKYKPYEDFATSGVKPETIQEALTVVEVMRNDPERVYNMLSEHLGKLPGQSPPGSGQVQDQGQQSADDMWENLSPALRSKLEGFFEEYGTLRDMSGIMAQVLVGKQNEDQSAQEDAELDELFDSFMEDPIYSALNQDGQAEPYMNSLLQADVKPEDAMKYFHGFVEHVLKTAGRPGSPRVLGPSGAIPTNNIDVRKATPQEARGLVAQMIADAAAAAD